MYKAKRHGLWLFKKKCIILKRVSKNVLLEIKCLVYYLKKWNSIPYATEWSIIKVLDEKQVYLLW